MSNEQIYALKGDADYALKVHSSLIEGVARFGWSTKASADLTKIRSIVETDGFNTLSPEQLQCWEKTSFLLDLKPGDWVIYVNVPVWGRCTLARVTDGYFWQMDDEDFNHRFHVDRSSVRDFDRNDAAVPAALAARLKLQGRYWHIYAEREFAQLRNELEGGARPAPRTTQSNVVSLVREMEPLLAEMTKLIQRTHPNTGLESLLKLVFEKVPGVRRVVKNGGAGDHGADLLVEYESGLPITSLQSQHTMVVQVKSFVGEHWSTRAVTDIERAFKQYPEADIGLIVSTADAGSPDLDEAITKLRENTGKRVELLIGADVARFILRFGNLNADQANSEMHDGAQR